MPALIAHAMTDHAAAVEAVKARHEADKQHDWPLDHWFDQLQEDRATLLRAYEAVVPVLDAALAWEGAWNDIFAYPHGFSHEEQALINAIRAYRAAKETP